MENNQEHKIDKIFKNSLENQAVTPPADAWMAVHTYTIGQEESKKKVLLRYASLTLLLLLFSGLGLWYYFENQTSKELFVNTPTAIKKNKELSVKTQITMEFSAKTPTRVRENINSSMKSLMILPKTPLKNAVRVLNPDSVKTSNQIVLMEEKPLIVEIDEDSLINEKVEFVGPVSYFNEHKTKEIDHKPLILNDLYVKIQKESEQKVVALDEKFIHKKEVYRADSVVFGKRFSLKHPIISLDLGLIWNFWNIDEYKYNQAIFPNESGANMHIGIAWKLNKKMRAGLKYELNNYNLGTAEISLPPWSSYLGVPTIKLIRENQAYRSELPFGNADIPIWYFQNSLVSFPNQLDTVRRIFFSQHSLKTASVSLNFNYDFVSRFKGKKKIYSYQIYSLTDIIIQRQTSYSFIAKDYYLGSSLQPINTITVIFYNSDRLQNASEVVFGLRAGLGFRYQFAKKWDFYVEGSGQHSLNNWVKSDDIKTFQRALSLQAGINLNL